MSQDAKAESESKPKAVDLQKQLDSTKVTAAKILQDVEKFGASSAEIKASQQEIQDITRRLESKSLSAANIAQAKKEIEETRSRLRKTRKKKKSPPRTMGGPTVQRAVDTNLVNVANRLYDEAGFTEKTGLGQTPVRPTFKQVKARLGLAVIEPILGGTQEALFPFAQSVATGRPATSNLRIIGAVATPTAADFVAGYVLAKTGATAVGRRALKKIELFILEQTDPLDAFKTAKTLSKADIDWWEEQEILGLIPRDKYIGPDGIAELRQVIKMGVKDGEDAVTSLQRTIEKTHRVDFTDPWKTKLKQIAEEAAENLANYRKSLDTGLDPRIAANEFEAGVTANRRLSQRLLGKEKYDLLQLELPFSESQLVKDQRNALRLVELKTFLNKNEGRTAMTENFIKMNIKSRSGKTSILRHPDWSRLELDAYNLVKFVNDNDALFADGTLLTSIIPTLSTRDARIVLEETTSLPKDEVDNIIEQLRELKQTSYQDTVQATQQIPDLGEKEVVEPGYTPDQEQPPDQVQAPAQTPAQILTPILDVQEEIIAEPIPEIIPLPPFIFKSKKRKAINLKLFRGPKRRYRVQHRYFDGTKTTVTVQAQSHPEAVAKAEGNRNRGKRLKEAISEEA